jgi:hypothetical protein
MTEVDPRLQPGAYITDGRRLYEVVRRRAGTHAGGFAMGCVLVEDCRTLSAAQVLAQRIRSAFRLVRPAPDPRCPDLVDEIVWEPAGAIR